MKKFFKILLIIIVVLLIVLISAPVIFKGKIIKIANEQLDKNLNAHAKFTDISISLIRNFPNLSIRIENLNVTGINEFEGDTLADIKSFDIAVDLISAIKMENIEIKRIFIGEPYINAIVLKDGKTNWDIAKPSEEAQPEDTSASDFNTKIQLKLFKISNAIIKYTDLQSNMSASLENMEFTLTGDLSSDFTNMVIDSRTEKFNYVMDGIRYAKNVLLQMHFDVDANLKESVYILKENLVALNALTLKWDGSIEMPESGDIITKLSFATSNTDFKTLLSLVPAIYMNDFADVKTTGSLKLEGNVTGAVTETATPNVDAKLVVSNATFSYPDLPQKAENIQLDVKLHYDGVQMDNTIVDVNKFHIDLGVNPIDMTMNLRTPISDPFTNGNLNMSIDLGTLKDVIPLKDMELTGLINAKLDWMGKYSSIEQENYEEFKADGQIQVLNLFYKSTDLPKEFILKKALINFSPKLLTLESFESRLGNSDFALTGKVFNYISYVLKDETLSGELSLNSDLIDLNEFMSDEDTVTTVAADTAPMAVVEVPGNIDFRFTSTINKIYYDNLIIDKVKGVIIVKDKAVKMQNLSMNLLDGSMSLSGEYNTLDMKNPFIDLDFSAKGFDIPKTTEAFVTIGKFAPAAKNATGKISLGMTYNSFLTQEMEPVMNTIAGKGELTSDQIGLKKSAAFSKIGDALKTDAFDNMVLKDIDISFEIIKGSIYIEPFETKLGDATLLIAGQQSLDNTIDYSVNISMPRKMLGLNNDAVNNLYTSAASKGVNIKQSENVNILAKVTGPIDDPKVSIDLKESTKQAVQEMKEEVKQAAAQIIEEKKEDVKVQARAEADKIIREAEKQAQIIRDEGKNLANSTRNEANINAEKVVKEAKNPVAKAAAKVSADKIKSEGEKQAKKIENEANLKADKVIQEARIKADNMLK